MTHIILLGDSIFDNSLYTRGEPDVVTHLRGLLPVSAQATLLAVDGAVTRSMTQQVSRIPSDATHLVVSIGGNDALGHADLLEAPARSTADALRHFDKRLASFEAGYRTAVSSTQSGPRKQGGRAPDLSANRRFKVSVVAESCA